MAIVCTLPTYLWTVRVLHIADVYLPKLGGIEKQVSRLVEIQRLRGNDVSVVTATHGPELERVFRVTSRLAFGLPLNFSAKKQLEKLFAQTNPEVIHIHTGVFSQFSWLAHRVSNQMKIPTLVTVHSIWGPLAQKLYRSFLLSRFVDSNTLVSAVSETAASKVRAVTRKEVAVTPNGVDLSHWQLAERTAHPETFRLVTATRLAARKRVLPLLFVFRKLLKSVNAKDRKVELHIAGTGISRRLLEVFVKLSGIGSQVVFHGRLDSKELYELFQESDVFVQLSVREAFGLAAIEARATGLPVVGRSGNGFVEFITDGKDGYLVDSDEIALQKLIHLIENPATLDELVANAKIRPGHGWDIASAKVQYLYELLVSPK
jgi:glycosyltransferase involved in cell wall biosynthesis